MEDRDRAKQVTAAILLRGREVFIAQRPPGDRLAFRWEFPGGTVEEGETPEACLKREMEEEFGIQVQVLSFFARSLYRYDHGLIDLQAYRVRWTGGRLQPRVHAAVAWVPISRLDRYDLAPADRPFVQKLRCELDTKRK
ncbi:8-oxo-dGTP diphosphatase [Desulfacinum hydrothermale DSM 13146]|uniref:8-oxo-dGTP diphosphatase n=1 Tax=Desulfacinum hydrothermale DSM 13146 TaxID=1121390 RepID=A0A1W1WY40_9BACT|nr:(deoxy)nucleoside triphosphate pyrophosphohydrolase [Desulfacinum hydrothermale]SMC16632.1 8-oxo-dGTP diphosphatase [Desulfacinum hydrothermale DSM 13146]